MGNHGNAFMSYGSFNPNTVAGLIAWYDANDSATITKASDRVSQWNDKSSEGNNLTQGTGADQPLWVDAVQNGKPIIRFDGVSESINDLITNTYTQPTTLFIVATSPTESASDSKAFIDGDSSRQIFNLQTTGVGYRVWAGTTLQGGTRQTGFKLFRVKFNSTSSSLHINNTSTLSGDAGTNSIEGFQIGASTHFGGGFANFDLCELLFYDADVSAGDITSIEAYLNAKWGLP